jgi:hypothetical protein
MDINALKSSLVEGDIVKASTALDSLYENWRELDPDDQEVINNLETIYINMAKAQLA